MDPSPEYLLAAARCVHAVATKEGLPREVVEGEVELYEAWSNNLTDDEQSFMDLIEAPARPEPGRNDG